MVSSAVAGFLASLALIAAIGAQNAFVLSHGLRREHVVPIIAICAASDAVLIGAGIGGLGVLILHRPVALLAIRWCGAVFLGSYAVIAARRALRPHALGATDRRPATLRATLVTCLALTYLNPHVYLDTVLLLGAAANQYPQRWLFGAGAALASLAWFTALGGGAHRLAPVLARPAAWRVLDGAVAVVMATITVTLIWT